MLRHIQPLPDSCHLLHLLLHLVQLPGCHSGNQPSKQQPACSGNIKKKAFSTELLRFSTCIVDNALHKTFLLPAFYLFIYFQLFSANIAGFTILVSLFSGLGVRIAIFHRTTFISVPVWVGAVLLLSLQLLPVRLFSRNFKLSPLSVCGWMELWTRGQSRVARDPDQEWPIRLTCFRSNDEQWCGWVEEWMDVWINQWSNIYMIYGYDIWVTRYNPHKDRRARIRVRIL